MAINITNVFPADPTAPLVPKRAFHWTDGFAITAEITCSQNLVGRQFDILYQLVNPRQDPLTGQAWFRPMGSFAALSPTIDFLFHNQPIVSQDFFMWMTGGGTQQYSDLMAPVGAGQLQGVFFVRALVFVPAFPDDFDISPLDSKYELF